MFSTVKMMGYDIFSDNLKKIKLLNIKDKFIINTINPHSFVISQKDKLFRDALKNSDVLLPDGSGIVLASKFLKKKKIKKIAGFDIHLHLLKELNEISGKCFYIGSNVSTLIKISKRLRREFPKINAEFYSPPYKEKFSFKENEYIINLINNFEPDVLFVGMTAPKQEKWVYNNYKNINAKVFCSIGAVFDFYAGTVKRPSDIWISLHLEWLFRFLKEPKRLWKRNLISTPLFLLYMILYYKNMNLLFMEEGNKENEVLYS